MATNQSSSAQQEARQEAQQKSSASAKYPAQNPAVNPEPSSTSNQMPSTLAKTSASSPAHLISLKEAENIVLHPKMGKERLIAMTDTVLAIIMTVLVLELPKPEIRDWQAIWGLRQVFLAYTISFFWIGAIWTALNRIWEHVRRIDSRTVLWTMILLFFTSFVPYTTSLESQYFNSAAMQTFYGVVVILITVTNVILHTVLDRCNTDNPTLLALTYGYRITLIIDFVIEAIGVIISAFVWPPAVVWSLLIAGLSMVVIRRILQKRMIARLTEARKLLAAGGTVDLAKLRHARLHHTKQTV
jgi:uncharacterized membrane protein